MTQRLDTNKYYRPLRVRIRLEVMAMKGAHISPLSSKARISL